MIRKPLRLRTLILILSVSLTFLIILITALFSVHSYDTSVVPLVTQMYGSSLHQASVTFDLQMNHYLKIVDSFITFNVRQPLSYIYKNPSSYNINKYKIQREILNNTNHSVFENIFVYTLNTEPINAYYDEPVLEPDETVRAIMASYIFDSDNVNTRGKYFVSRQAPFHIAVFKPVFFNTTFVGGIQFDLDMRFFFSIVNTLTQDGFDNIWLSDHNNNILYSTNKSNAIKPEANNKDNIQYMKLTAVDWLFSGELPQEKIATLMYNSVGMIILMLLLLLGIFVLFSFILSRSVNRPLAQIMSGMERIRANDLSVVLPMKRIPYEYQNIINTFNSMVKQINILLNTIETQHELVFQSEMKNLRSMLDPHFLYNTLDMLYWEMIKSEQNQCASMVVALSELLRYSIQQKGEYVTVMEELHQVQNYLKLQSVRMGTNLEWNVETDGSIENLAIPILLIQPLVENSFKHAFPPEQKYKYIGVNGYTEGDYLVFVIVDNGIGIDSEKIKQILSTENQGVGLQLVKRRIALIYGSECGISIESPHNQGCLIKVKLLKNPPERKGS